MPISMDIRARYTTQSGFYDTIFIRPNSREAKRLEKEGRYGTKQTLAQIGKEAQVKKVAKAKVESKMKKWKKLWEEF